MCVFLKSQRGQTLVQTLMSIGITAIVIAAVSAFTIRIQRSNKLLSQKLEVLDLKNQLLTNFINPETCTCQLNPNLNTANSSNLKFNSTNPASFMDLKEIRSGCTSTAFSMVKEGASLPGTQTALVAETIRMVGIESTGRPDEYYGNIEVSFTSASKAGPLAPLRIRQKFFTDPSSPPTAKVPISCYSELGSLKVASGQNVVGTNSTGSVSIDLESYGFDSLGTDPHILVSERDYNYDAVDGNTMDASYCGFVKNSRLRFTVTCWASPNNSSGNVRSSFDWIALQK